ADSNGQFTANNVAVGNLLVAARISDPVTHVVRSGSVAATLATAGAVANVDVLIFGTSGGVEGTVFQTAGSQQSSVESAAAGITVEVWIGNVDLATQGGTVGGGHFRILGFPPGVGPVQAVGQEPAEETTVPVTVVATVTAR